MKRLLVVALVLGLWVPTVLLSQQGKLETHSLQLATLTGNDTVSVYLGFQGKGGTEDFSATAINPNNLVKFYGGRMSIYAIIDSLAATGTDTLQAFIEMLGHDGYVMSSTTIWLDFANNAIATTAKNLIDWTPFNRVTATLGVSGYTFWIDLTDTFPPCYGLKFTFYQYSTVSPQSRITLYTAEGY